MNVDHLNGGEFLEHAARGQARREPFQAAAEGDVQTISEEGDEDVRLDALLFLMVDRADGEVALERSKRLLHLDQLEVEAPQGGGIALGQIAAQQIAPFAPARPPERLPV